MKAKRDHRVPLSARALEILHEARELSGGSDLLFPSAHGRALTDNAISKLVRNLALAHVNSDRVEAAYPRTDLFERRRVLMEEWSAFVGRSPESGEH